MNIESDMDKYRKMMQKQYPKQNLFAIRHTLNKLAETSRQQAVTKGTAEFTKRNTYINRSIRFEKVTGMNNPDSMSSMFGQMAKMHGKPAGQLAIQETGGVLKPKVGKSLRLGTAASRSGKSLRRPIRQNAAKSKFLTPKKFFKNSPTKPHTKRGQAIGLIAWAKRNKFKGLIKMHSPQKNRYGAFQVAGSKNQPKFNMIFNLEKKSQNISATHWMEKSYRGPVSKRDELYKYYMKDEIISMKRDNGF